MNISACLWTRVHHCIDASLQGDFVGCAGTFIAQEMYFAVIVDTFVSVSRVLRCVYYLRNSVLALIHFFLLSKSLVYFLF